MGIRDKIKLRAKPKIKNRKTDSPKKTDFSYDNIISQKVEESDENLQKKYNEIIVKYNYF